MDQPSEVAYDAAVTTTEESSDIAARETGEVGPFASPAMQSEEAAIDAVLRDAHLAGPHNLADLVTGNSPQGSHDPVIYLADLQQRVLLPVLPARPPVTANPGSLGVDSTVAGRAFQLLQVQTQDLRTPGGGKDEVRVWLPLLNGTERLGVLSVTVTEPAHLEDHDGVLLIRLQRFASLVAELIVTKNLYGDSLVRLRRTARMGLAAEMQWALLPPLTFTCDTVTLAAGLEPAYEVAGDSFDYAVDAGVARFAVFDGMGHGLTSAQLSTLAVAAYRNARRALLSLTETVEHMDASVLALYQQEAFVTALVGELDTVTGLFSWLSAGHLDPVLLREGRVVRTLSTEPMLPLGLGTDLGGDASMPARPVVRSEQLQPGDLLLLYTDGIVEARSPDGEFFGIERLMDIVIRNLAAGLAAPETMRRVVRALLEHQSGDLDDDATLVLVQWHGDPRGRLTP